jgi:hypothetical protein
MQQSHQEVEMLKTFQEKRDRAAQAWSEAREGDALGSQSLVRFEKDLAEARQSYEVAVAEAWKLYEERLIRPTGWPAGHQTSKTRRNAIAQAWKSYQDATVSALETFRKEAGNTDRYEHALYLLYEERVTLGGEVPDHVQEILDRVQEDIICIQDTLDWVQQIMDDPPVETVMPDGTRARSSMDKSRESVGLLRKYCGSALRASDTHEALLFMEPARKAVLQAAQIVDELSRLSVGGPDPDMMQLVLIRLVEAARALEEMLYDLGGVETGLEYAQKHSVTR